MEEVWGSDRRHFCAVASKKSGVEVRADARALPPETSNRRRAAYFAYVRSAPTSGASIAGERTRGDAGRCYALRVTLLLRIGSGSRAMVYKPHQQNDVDGLKHDDEQ